jgi:hypothetical protein
LTGGLISDKLKMKNDSKNESIIDDYKVVREEFILGLKELISTIFNYDEPFTMTSDIRGKCTYCPYRELCMR